MSRVIYVTPSITLLINVYVNAGIELSLDTTLPIREDRNFRYWIRNGQNHSLANSFSRIGPKYRDGRRNCTFVTLFFSVFPPLSLSLPPFFFFFSRLFFVYRMRCTLRVGFDRISQFTPGLSIKPSAILLMATACFLSGTTINFRLDPPGYR